MCPGRGKDISKGRNFIVKKLSHTAHKSSEILPSGLGHSEILSFLVKPCEQILWPCLWQMRQLDQEEHIATGSPLKKNCNSQQDGDT